MLTALVPALDDWAKTRLGSGPQATVLGGGGLARPPTRGGSVCGTSLIRRDAAALRGLAEDPSTAMALPLSVMMLALSLPQRDPNKHQLLTAAHTRHPEDFWLNVELANSHAAAGRKEVAAGFLRAAVAVNPKSAVHGPHLAWGTP